MDQNWDNFQCAREAECFWSSSFERGTKRISACFASIYSETSSLCWKISTQCKARRKHIFHFFQLHFEGVMLLKITLLVLNQDLSMEDPFQCKYDITFTIQLMQYLISRNILLQPIDIRQRDILCGAMTELLCDML